MAVVHVKKRENPYVQIDKRVFEDPRLSWRAKGIMGYLLSKPDGWKVNVVDIWGKGKEGRNAVQDCMSELAVFGYAELVTTHNDQGVFTGKEWVVSEEPKGGFTDATEKPKTEAPKTRKSVFRSNSNNDLNSNNEEGEEEEKNTPTRPKDFDEMLQRVNAEVATIEAEKEKGSPVPAAPSNEPSTSPNTRYMVATVEADTLPGHVVTAVEVVTVPGTQQPTNPDAAKALLAKMGRSQPKDPDAAQNEIRAWVFGDGSETVRVWYEKAKRKDTPEDRELICVEKFCSVFALSLEPGRRMLFENDPLYFFQKRGYIFILDECGYDRKREQSAKTPTVKRSGAPNSFGGDQSKFKEVQRF